FGCSVPGHIGSLLPVVTFLYNDIGGGVRVAFPRAPICAVASTATTIFWVVAGIPVADVIQQFTLVGELGIVGLCTPANHHVAVVQRLGIGHRAGRAFFRWRVFGDHRGGHLVFVHLQPQTT